MLRTPVTLPFAMMRDLLPLCGWLGGNVAQTGAKDQ
jgi:hypothetical protein